MHRLQGFFLGEHVDGFFLIISRMFIQFYLSVEHVIQVYFPMS